MKIAVLTLTRDRLEYTQHCFAKLAELAGCEYDHFVLDQASTDGTREWLAELELAELVQRDANIGISRGLNVLLNLARGYDVIVKFDNDCELITPNTLRDVAALTLQSGWILGPVMHGYGTELVTFGDVHVGGYVVSEKQQIQGCFLAATGEFYESFRYSAFNPIWGGDDPQVCAFMRNHGGHVGAVLGYEANHYESTWGQEERYPEYFARKIAEGLPWP